MRNEAYEKEALSQLSRICEKGGLNGETYVNAVRQRLEIGRARYGDDNFRRIGIDAMFKELLEETPDIAGYGLLLAQLLLDDEDDTEAIFHLWEAIKCAAAADHHARLARNYWRDV